MPKRNHITSLLDINPTITYLVHNQLPSHRLIAPLICTMLNHNPKPLINYTKCLVTSS